MGGLLKKLVFITLGIAALLVIVAVAFVLIFDPNDFRDKIASAVQEQTGRELTIEGDIELSFFPWFAVEVGKTTLGNAPGFGDQPFASFEQARLSVGVMPMLLRREVSVAAATLDAFQLNLAVAGNGQSNWQDLLDAGAEEEVDAETGEGETTLDIAGIAINDAIITYTDAQLGESYSLSNFDLNSGRVARGEPLQLQGNFDFEMQPADLSGDVEIETTLILDGDAGTVAFANTEVTALGVDLSADVAPFSYLQDDVPTAVIQVDAFSLKSLLERLGIEPPVTSDPDALGKIIIDAQASMKPDGIELSDLELVVDDTTFKGSLAVASNAAGTISIQLAGDSMDVDRYMAPAETGDTSGSDAAAVEVPVDLIRDLNVRGNLTLQEATLSGLVFKGVTLGLNASNGALRLHPISAGIFGGQYDGDVRINAAGNVPVLTVDEKIVGVNLGTLAEAMFDQENITGAINGAFQLRGAGDTLAAMQRSLNGTMSMELLDGVWEGKDLWYELRRARALFKKEPAPEPELPARTRFSTVKASGPVTDGVFRNNDLLAELPHIRLTGKGEIDLAAATVDYRMSARILERPEFIAGATEEELDEFTEAVIPIKISGSLAAPSIAPDIETMLKDEAKKEVKDRLFDKLLGGDDEEDDAGATGEGATDKGSTDDEPKKESDRDKVKGALRDLLGG